MRKEYSDRHQILDENDIIDDPFELFHYWFEMAKQNAPDDKWTETNAVCLSTATKLVQVQHHCFVIYSVCFTCRNQRWSTIIKNGFVKRI